MGKASTIMELTIFIMENGNMIKNLGKVFINMEKGYIMDLG